MDYHEQVFDARRGRKPISQAWTEQGWSHESTWAVVLPTWFPSRSTLVVHEDARAGIVALSINGFDVTQEDDGA